MPDRILYAAWRDENARRAYPFGDDATLQNGSRQIPVSAFLDARIYTTGLPDTYLSAVRTDGQTVWLTFRDDGREVATGQTDPPDQPLVRLSDPYGRPAGVVLLSDEGLSDLRSWGPGSHVFSKAATRLANSAVVPIPPAGVQAFLLPDGSIVSGEVWFVAGPGLIFEAEGGQPVLHVVGDPYVRQRLCAEANLPIPPFRCFRTINNLAPGAAGNINLTTGDSAADSILRIDASVGEIHVHLAGAD